MRSEILGIAAASLALMGCGEPQSGDATDDVGWTALAIDSTITIGGSPARGPAALGLVRGIALAADPLRVGVADWQVQAIQVFDGEGRYVETFGRRGEGPGEYEALTEVVIDRAGRFVGWDATHRRLTIHGERGDSVIRVDLTAFADREPQFLGVLDQGDFVFALPVAEGSLRGRDEGEFRDTVPVVRVDGTGAVAGTLDRIEAPRRGFFSRGAMWGLEADLFGPALVVAVVPRYGVANLRDASPVVRFDGAGGSATRYVEMALRVPTAELVSTERDRRIAAVPSVRANGVDLAEEWREVVASLPAADTIPAFDALIGAEDGSVWLRQFVLTGDSVATWLQVAAEAAPRMLQLPVDEDIRAATGDVIATLATDEFGAAVVRLHWVRP